MADSIVVDDSNFIKAVGEKHQQILNELNNSKLANQSVSSLDKYQHLDNPESVHAREMEGSRGKFCQQKEVLDNLFRQAEKVCNLKHVAHYCEEFSEQITPLIEGASVAIDKTDKPKEVFAQGLKGMMDTLEVVVNTRIERCSTPIRTVVQSPYCQNFLDIKLHQQIIRNLGNNCNEQQLSELVPAITVQSGWYVKAFKEAVRAENNLMTKERHLYNKAVEVETFMIKRFDSRAMASETEELF